MMVDFRKIGVVVMLALLAGCQASEIRPAAVSQQQQTNLAPAVPAIHGPDAAPKVKGPGATP